MTDISRALYTSRWAGGRQSCRALRAASIALVTVSLTACGGDGGSDSATVTISTPKPSPTPSASPTPTPSISYLAFDRLSGSHEFNSGCGNWFGKQWTDSEFFGSYPENPEALAHKYDEPSDSWQIAGAARDDASAPEYSYLFEPSDLDPQATDAERRYGFIDTNSFPVVFSIVRRVLGGTDAKYVRETRLVAKPGDYKIDIRCVIGVPTENDDTLPSGTFSYRDFALTGTAHGSAGDYDLGESTASWSIDPQAMTAKITIDFVGRAITGSGLSSTKTSLGRFTTPFAYVQLPFKGFGGTIFNSNAANANSAPAGSYGGSFFGPQGIEIGMGFALASSQSGSQLVYTGTLIGRR